MLGAIIIAFLLFTFNAAGIAFLAFNDPNLIRALRFDIAPWEP